MRVLLALFGLLLAVVVSPATAATPANLEAWRAWVLKDMEYRSCPLIAGRNGVSREEFICAWPGVLSITADADGANINQRWRVENDGWIPLPGDHDHWPLQVMLDNQPVPVVDRQGPHLWLKTGMHDVRARISWDERPQTLTVDASIALISLSVDGKPVAPLQRNGNALTLGRGANAVVEADSIDLQVFRKFSDGVPEQLTTVIRVSASGQAREEVIGPALPEDFVPLELESEEWPARLAEDGRLHVQVQPGMNEITLTARTKAPMERLTSRFPEAWATQEIWSYEVAPNLRVTHVSGAVQVDPRQAGVPDEWTDFPAFAMGADDALTIEERSRGLDANVANRLNLDREAWLDFSGSGWFARDRIYGSMENGWRLDVLAPYVLQRADAGGADQGLLVTRGATAELSGVEWRTPNVALAAGLRINSGTGRLPVTGWQQTFDQVSTTLHLPYGYRLLAAPGADRSSGSWLSRWSLLDVFLVAIMVLLAARLLGKVAGFGVAMYLLLGYQEAGAPLWTLLTVLAFAMIARALPEGRLSQVAVIGRNLVLIVLVLIALPFAASQLRQAVHPQLEAGQGGFAPIAFQVAAPAPAPPPPPVVMAEEADHYARSAAPEPSRSAANDKLETIVVTGSRIRRADLMSKYSESTVVQTGGGEPGWRIGNEYRLNWAGPVLATQEVNLIVASPWMVRSLRVLLVVLLGWLIVSLVRERSWRWKSASTNRVTAAAIVVGGMLFAPVAFAQEYPSESLLQQFRARLLEAPRCVPACANIAQAQVIAQGDELRVSLDVHAAENVAIPLPMDEKVLTVRSIKLDGATLDTSTRINDRPWVQIARGVHRIEVVYAATGDRVALSFAMPPHQIRFDGTAWQTSGISDQRLLTETLVLVRARTADEPVALVGTQQFAPFVRLTRDFSLDLQWQVLNNVERLAPSEGGFSIDLPTIAGEHLSTAGLKVREGRVTVSMANDQERTDWRSTLDQSETIVLTAPPMTGHVEVWRFAVSPTWHVEFDGIAQSGSSNANDGDDYRAFEFHPLPGESLTVRISKPAAVEGSTRAIDTLRIQSEFGARARTHVLDMALRASQGGEQGFALPEGMEVLGVTRDGAPIGVRANNGRLSLPVSPGEQNYQVRMRENLPIGFSAATPAFVLDLPAANIDLSVTLPSDRWLLAAFGPSVGPAVLFWGELLVAIVLAWLLSRVWRSELRFHHWLLLVLGFSTFSWLALGVVVVWLYVLDWRKRRVAATPWKFNLVQVGIAGLTMLALGCLVASIQNGLLGRPDMVVSGADSYAGYLHWFADRTVDALPVATVISLPLWAYNLMMLVWALWLAWALVGWLRKGFAAWTTQGYWRPLKRSVEPSAIDVSSVPPPPPPA